MRAGHFLHKLRCNQRGLFWNGTMEGKHRFALQVWLSRPSSLEETPMWEVEKVNYEKYAFNLLSSFTLRNSVETDKSFISLPVKARIKG